MVDTCELSLMKMQRKGTKDSSPDMQDDQLANGTGEGTQKGRTRQLSNLPGISVSWRKILS